MKQGLLAINVCLLPSKEAAAAFASYSAKVCDAPNSDLLGTPNHYCVKNGQPPIPHLTLCQAFVEPGALEGAQRELDAVFKSCRAAKLNITHLADGALFAKCPKAGEIHLPWYSLEKTSELQALHEAVVLGVKNHCVDPDTVVENITKEKESGKTDKDDTTATAVLGASFHSHSSGNELSVRWVLNYFKNSSGSRWDPHVTLGAASKASLQSGEGVAAARGMCGEVVFDRVALAHMGNFCSCYEPLVVWDLR